MFIKTDSGRVLNSRYCRTFSTGDAAIVREVRHGNGGTTYASLPRDGWLLLAWMSGPVCVGCYQTQEQADHALTLLFCAMGEARCTFIAPR
jgi:hypothetical protein